MNDDAHDLGSPALREFLDGVSDLVQSVLPDGRIRFVNRAWCERLGHAVDDVVGRNLFEFIHPESRDHCLYFMKRLLSGEQLGVMAAVFVTKAGAAVHVEGKVTVAFADGAPVVTRGVFREAAADRADAVSLVRLREQRRMFHSVLAILRGNMSRDRRAFLALATAQVAQALGVARASVWLFDDARSGIACEDLWADGTPQGKVDMAMRRADHPDYFAAIDSREPIVADDAVSHPATRSFADGYLRPLGIRAMIDLPLQLGAATVGVLCCEHVGAPRAWTGDEREFGMAVAAIVLIYLENERRVAAERELQRLNSDLERRVAERTQQIAAVEQRLAYMLTSVSAVVFACEAGGDFRTTFVSPNAESQFGYSSRVLLADARFWRSRLHPDDAAGGQRALRETLATGASTYEYRFHLPNGSYRWFRDEYTLMRDLDGRPVEIIGSCIDIHDRRIAEQAAEAVAADLRRIVENANAPILGEDVHGRIDVWNACAERLTGYTRVEALGRGLSDFVVAERREAVIAAFDDALAGRDAAVFDLPLRAKDGRAIYLLLSASARRDASGAIVGVVAVGQDITEHREAQQRGLRAQRLESIGTLAGGVAHDVNNALAPILLATGLLRERHPESGELLELMESSARRGASMVKQLLTFAKGVDGKRVPVPLQILLAELERFVRNTFPKNIDVLVACDPAAPAVNGDSTQLHQVLLNLCVNAIDAMPDGGRLAIEVVRAELTVADAQALGDAKPGAYVRIGISDTGCGIAPELLDRIFEPFFSTKSPEQGTGLGLSTTLGIVRSHGGFMRVQSQPGAGTEFAVYLPAADAEAPRAATVGGAAACVRGHGQRILLVDDEQIVRSVIVRLLAGLGYAAEAVAGGDAALALLRDPAKDVALVITDLHMPGMDGLQLTREIRRLRPDVPVVLASGFSDKVDPAQIGELGFAAQLDKPFGLDALTQTLANALA
jgi:PAS domain S-box-containing protein